MLLCALPAHMSLVASTARLPLQSAPDLSRYLLTDGLALGASVYLNIALAGGSILAFVFMARTIADPRATLIAVATIAVPVVSLLSYTGLASGLTIGLIELPAGHPLSGATLTVAGETYDGVISMWGRYLTWAFSTPFILLALGLLAGSNLTKLVTAIVFDVAMCLTGLAAAVTTSSVWFRWWWFLLSSACFLVVLYVLFVAWPRDAKRTGTLEPIFNTLKTLTVVTWFGYPLVWAVGVEGFGLLSVTLTSWAYSLLDVAAKYVFAYLLLRYLVAEPDPVTAAADYGASLPGITPSDD